MAATISSTAQFFYTRKNKQTAGEMDANSSPPLCLLQLAQPDWKTHTATRIWMQEDWTLVHTRTNGIPDVVCGYLISNDPGASYKLLSFHQPVVLE